MSPAKKQKATGKMTRRTFIESHGATCRGWYWSWSFINKRKKFIIFGAWDRYVQGDKSLIFTESWQFNKKGKRNAGYNQSREHIRLIEEEGYELLTFPMRYSGATERFWRVTSQDGRLHPRPDRTQTH